jgi:hypothetical protein
MCVHCEKTTTFRGFCFGVFASSALSSCERGGKTITTMNMCTCNCATHTMHMHTIHMHTSMHTHNTHTPMHTHHPRPKPKHQSIKSQRPPRSPRPQDQRKKEGPLDRPSAVGFCLKRPTRCTHQGGPEGVCTQLDGIDWVSELWEEHHGSIMGAMIWLVNDGGRGHGVVNMVRFTRAAAVALVVVMVAVVVMVRR